MNYSNLDVFIWLQVQLSERIIAATAAEENLRELEAKVKEQKTLIVKLEEDILKVPLHSLRFYSYTFLASNKHLSGGHTVTLRMGVVVLLDIFV